jgi:hypothetical protein
MATGDLITATRYNQIQATVSSVLGIGAGDSGYGQPLVSSQVTSTQVITADHMNRLRTDMLTTFVHQTGSNSGFALPVLELGTDLVSFGTGKTEYESYPLLASTLLSNRNTYSSQSLLSNFTPEFNKITSSRNTAWGGTGQAQTVTHEVQVRFESVNDRRYFFNTGSEIRFEASLSNFPGGDGLDKFNNWAGMLLGMGTISFKSFTTTRTGSGTALPIGNFNLTNLYQTIFVKTGTGIYSNNTYTISVKETDSRTIQFKIDFNDLDAGSNLLGGGPVDEPVEGVLISRVNQFRSTGTSIVGINKVTTSSPIYQNIKNL